jgi:hypothetical protein
LHIYQNKPQESKMAEKTVVETDLNVMTNRKDGSSVKRSLRRKMISKLQPLQQSLQQEVVPTVSTHCDSCVNFSATLISPSITEKKKKNEQVSGRDQEYQRPFHNLV